MTFILIVFGLMHPHHTATVAPESVIITPDFEAVWVPEGMTGPIVAIPEDVEVFQ